VATLLDGSVRKSGNRVRISVQLIQAADRVQLWAETYDRSLDDIFAVQDDIAQAVVRELRTALLGEAPDSKSTGAAQAAIARASVGHGVQNPEAHRLYLQGKYLIDRVNPEDTEKGLRYLEQSVAIDPTFALPYVEMARAYINIGGYGWEPVRVGYEKARKAVLRALELAPDLPEAHTRHSAILRMHDWNWREAEAATRRALELDPSNAEALRSAGGIAHFIGHSMDEAIEFYLRAIEIDPLQAGGYTGLAHVYRSLSRIPEAEQAIRKAIELAPQRVGNHLVLAYVLAEQGRFEEAMREASREVDDWARLTAIATVHYYAGQMRESDEALQELKTRFAVDASYQIAAVHTIRGEIDAAFQSLDRAILERDSGVAQVVAEPAFRRLHADPRWSQLLRKLNFDIRRPG
jgi:serine/threonine-protein kinase